MLASINVNECNGNMSFPVKLNICVESAKIGTERSKEVAGTLVGSYNAVATDKKLHLKWIGARSRVAGSSNFE